MFQYQQETPAPAQPNAAALAMGNQEHGEMTEHVQGLVAPTAGFALRKTYVDLNALFARLQEFALGLYDEEQKPENTMGLPRMRVQNMHQLRFTTTTYGNELADRAPYHSAPRLLTIGTQEHQFGSERFSKGIKYEESWLGTPEGEKRIIRQLQQLERLQKETDALETRRALFLGGHWGHEKKHGDFSNAVTLQQYYTIMQQAVAGAHKDYHGLEAAVRAVSDIMASQTGGAPANVVFAAEGIVSALQTSASLSPGYEVLAKGGTVQRVAPKSDGSISRIPIYEVGTAQLYDDNSTTPDYTTSYSQFGSHYLTPSALLEQKDMARYTPLWDSIRVRDSPSRSFTVLSPSELMDASAGVFSPSGYLVVHDDGRESEFNSGSSTNNKNMFRTVDDSGDKIVTELIGNIDEEFLPRSAIVRAAEAVVGNIGTETRTKWRTGLTHIAQILEMPLVGEDIVKRSAGGAMSNEALAAAHNEHVVPQVGNPAGYLGQYSKDGKKKAGMATYEGIKYLATFPGNKWAKDFLEAFEEVAGTIGGALAPSEVANPLNAASNNVAPSAEAAMFDALVLGGSYPPLFVSGETTAPKEIASGAIATRLTSLVQQTTGGDADTASRAQKALRRLLDELVGLAGEVRDNPEKDVNTSAMVAATIPDADEDFDLWALAVEWALSQKDGETQVAIANMSQLVENIKEGIRTKKLKTTNMMAKGSSAIIKNGFSAEAVPEETSRGKALIRSVLEEARKGGNSSGHVRTPLNVTAANMSTVFAAGFESTLAVGAPFHHDVAVGAADYNKYRLAESSAFAVRKIATWSAHASNALPLMYVATRGNAHEIREFQNLIAQVKREGASVPEPLSPHEMLTAEFLVYNTPSFRKKFEFVKLITDPIVRAAALAYMQVPLHRNAVMHLCDHRVPLPWRHLVFQPFRTARMGHIVVMHGGSPERTGFLGNQEVSFTPGTNASHKESVIHMTYRTAVALHNHRNVTTIPNVKYVTNVGRGLGGYATSFVRPVGHESPEEALRRIVQHQKWDEGAMLAMVVPLTYNNSNGNRAVYQSRLDLTGTPTIPWYDATRDGSDIQAWPMQSHYDGVYGLSSIFSDNDSVDAHLQQMRASGSIGRLNSETNSGYMQLTDTNGDWTIEIQSTGYEGPFEGNKVDEVRAGGAGRFLLGEPVNTVAIAPRTH